MLNRIKRGYNNLPPSRKIAFSFLLVILLGALLLWLPISNQDGKFLSFVDALFTATSATCVTGLVVEVTAEQFTLFGQIVIISLIQIGGLGLMTLVALFVLMMKNRLSMKEKIAMRDMLNKNNIFDMKAFLTGIICYTALFEGIGAVFLSFRLIPKFGFWEGLFHSFFLSISAFCNAGFDCIGPHSLIPYSDDLIVNFTIMSLIIVGGIGFAIWFDVRDKLSLLIKRKLSFRKALKQLSTHTKIVLSFTFVLVFGGAVTILLLELNNPQTFQQDSLFEMFLPAMFQSVTLRTAGFASMDLGSCTIATKLFMMVLMFIGGSPGGTAGGIKTTTFFVLVIFIWTMLKGESDARIFHRTIPKEAIMRASNVMTINIITLFTGLFVLCISDAQLGFINLAFEAVSAIGTVGLTLGITTMLSTFGKCIIILLMFVGRIGITTLLLTMVKMKTTEDRAVTYPNCNILIG